MSPPGGTPACLAGRDLRFARRGRSPAHEVLRGASLALHPGELLALLGANGAGKSTLLRLLLGLLRPDSGEVLLDGRPLAGWQRREQARRMAYVPQNHMPPFPYTVRDVAALGRLPHRGLLRAAQGADHQRVDEVLQQLGLSALAARPYTEVSGGERQLVLIARALVQGATILLLDEPASGLDYGNQLRLLERLRALADDGHAVLFTTHHPDHARAAADRVALLHRGRIGAEGAPGDVLTDAALGELYGLFPLKPLQSGGPLAGGRQGPSA
jgi:iron complex transport system ATP-binding protein